MSSPDYHSDQYYLSNPMSSDSFVDQLLQYFTFAFLSTWPISLYLVIVQLLNKNRFNLK